MAANPPAGRPFAPAEYAARLQAVRSAMRERGLGTLLVVAPENINYLLGLDYQGYFAFTLLVLGAEGQPALVTRAMERATVSAQVPDCVHVTYEDGEDPAGAALAAIRQVASPDRVVGVERAATFFPIGIWERIREALPERRWADGSGTVDDLRATKSPAELAHVRRAAAASDRAMQAGIAAAGAGVSELEVAAAVYRELVLAGSEYPGLAPLIRSIDVLQLEHVTWRDRTLAGGGGLFLELSASVARYHAPLSRVVHVEHVPHEAMAASEVALAGLEAIQRTLRPGVVTGDVYAAWQAVIDEGLGHSRHRRHHCGYMVGIGFPPSWVGGSAVVGIRAGGDLVVREGMVFHAMSWISGQARGAYVVSDTALVTSAGCELLTSTPHGPTVVA